MTFIVHGLNIHEQMPLNKLFKSRVVEKTQKSSPLHTVDTDHGSSQQRKTVDHIYQAVEQLHHDKPALFSNQIMTSPVVTLTPQTSVAEAHKLFESKKFRHVPVVSADNLLIGMVSDRDILRYLSNITSVIPDKNRQITTPSMSDPISQLMQKQVLTASVDTDVRYIAMLFVGQHIGAMPIMEQENLIGIITRSDILRAVMHHYDLQLWV
jgi:acetoin utilization protein AcuB